MSYDRVIKWGSLKPSNEEVQKVLEDYFSGVIKVEWDKDRWFIYLPGYCSSALKRVSNMDLFSDATRERWIEIWPSNDCLFVMTRQQDEFTNAIAGGLVEVFSRYWCAKVEL